MKQRIENIIKRKDKDILFVGVGSVLRNDDGVGIFIVSNIENRDHISTLLVEVSIENYINKYTLLGNRRKTQ